MKRLFSFVNITAPCR